MSDAFNKDRLYAENQDLKDRIAELVKRTAKVELAFAILESHNLEQQRKGFWLGFEDARCHPDEMNILNQWENTKVFIEAKGGAV